MASETTTSTVIPAYVAAPFATSEKPCVSADIPGSKPDWHRANMHNKGRASPAAVPPSVLGGGGFSHWYSDAWPPAYNSRRHYTVEPTLSMAEPVALTGHQTYYARRRIQTADDALHFRPTRRSVPMPSRPDRPEGRRWLPEPRGKAQCSGVKPATDEQRNPARVYAPEPDLPRIGRVPGHEFLRECDQETSLGRAVGSKGKAPPGRFKGLGMAGDLSVRFGVEARVEDNPDYFRTLKDSPTFTRFCASLPGNKAAGAGGSMATSPHVRHAACLQAKQQTERRQERQEVAALSMWPDGC